MKINILSYPKKREGTVNPGNQFDQSGGQKFEEVDFHFGQVKIILSLAQQDKAEKKVNVHVCACSFPAISYFHAYMPLP